MRKKLIPETKIIALSKEVLHSFYNRNIETYLHYLADDFLWIGAFDFQFTMNKADFLKTIQSELNSQSFTMLDEEFMLLSKTPTTYIVCARYKLIAQNNDNSLIRTHTRMTIIWKYIGDELKLCHVHGSNSQDIPISITTEDIPLDPPNEFFTYLNSLNLTNTKDKLVFRDMNGNFKYFIESEILYLEANSQSTYLYTSNECLEISGILLENSKKLSSTFYRIHKSYIVNSLLVTSLKRYQVTLTNNQTFPVSKEKYIAFREFLARDK